MKKLLLVSVFLMTGPLFAAGDADFIIPKSDNNVMDLYLKSTGVEKALLVTSTIPALATDRLGTTMTAGLIYWIISPSTAAATSVFCELRDTATANTTSASLIPRTPTAVNGAAGATSNIIVFDPPVPFYNGLSVNLLPLGAAPNGGIEFAVGIRSRE